MLLFSLNFSSVSFLALRVFFLFLYLIIVNKCFSWFLFTRSFFSSYKVLAFWEFCCCCFLWGVAFVILKIYISSIVLFSFLFFIFIFSFANNIYVYINIYISVLLYFLSIPIVNVYFVHGITSSSPS